MNSCELVSTVTALACVIANCVPKEDLPLLSSIFGQLSSTLATISIQEEALSGKPATSPIPPTEEIITEPLP